MDTVLVRVPRLCGPRPDLHSLLDNKHPDHPPATLGEHDYAFADMPVTTTTTTTTAGPSGGLRRHASAFNLRDPRNKPLPPAPVVDNEPARPVNATEADPFPTLSLAHDLVLPLLPVRDGGGTTSTVLHHTGSRPRSRSDPRPFSSYMIARDVLEQQSTQQPALALPQLAPRPVGGSVPVHDPRAPSPPDQTAGGATLIRLPPARLPSVRRAGRPNTPASLAPRTSLQRSQSAMLHLPRVAPRADPVVRRTSPIVEPRAVVPLHLAHLARTEPRSRPRRDNSVRLHGPATAPRPTLALPQLAGPAPPPSAPLARPAEPDQLVAESVDDDDASGFYDTASVTRIVRSALRDPAPPYRDPAAPYLPDLDPQTGRPLTTAALTLTPELTQAVLALMQGHYIPSLRAAPGSSSTASSTAAAAAPPPMTSWTTATGAIGRAPANSTSTTTTATTAPLATLSAWTVLGNARAGAENTRAYLCYGGIHVATLAVLPPTSSTDDAPGVVIALTPRLPLADLDPGSMPRGTAGNDLHGNLVLYLVSENRTVTMTTKDRGYAAQILEFVGARPSAPPLPDRHRSVTRPRSASVPATFTITAPSSPPPHYEDLTIARARANTVATSSPPVADADAVEPRRGSSPAMLEATPADVPRAPSPPPPAVTVAPRTRPRGRSLARTTTNWIRRVVAAVTKSRDGAPAATSTAWSWTAVARRSTERLARRRSSEHFHPAVGDSLDTPHTQDQPTASSHPLVTRLGDRSLSSESAPRTSSSRSHGARGCGPCLPVHAGVGGGSATSAARVVEPVPAFMGAVPDRTASLDLSAAAAAAAAAAVAASSSALGSATASLAPASPAPPVSPTAAGDTTLHRVPHDNEERLLPVLPAADVPVEVEDDEDDDDNRSLRSTATVDSGSRVSSTLYHAPLGGAMAVGSDVALVAVVRDAMAAESVVGIEDEDLDVVDREDAASSVAGVFGGSEIMAVRPREAVGSPQEGRLREMLV
ncbi:hypothetical protein GGF32_004963 [Allomyces javanicus]|nr:hypothetical protein GGF32_004963 [Allomyces javanicus]